MKNHMRLLFLLLVLSCLAIGCTVTTVITPDASSAKYEDANRAAGHYAARVLTTSGSVHHGHSVCLAADSIKWKLIEPEFMQELRASGIHVTAERRQILPTLNVREVRIKDTNRGMWHGFVFGFLSGLAVGSVVQATDTHYLPSGYFVEPLIGQWLIEVVGGTCIGAVTGSLTGSTSIIRFQQGGTPPTTQ